MNAHATQIVKTGTATLEDINAADVEDIVRYWHESSDEHLDFLGIDRALLGGAENTRARYLRAIRTGTSFRRRSGQLVFQPRFIRIGSSSILTCFRLNGSSIRRGRAMSA